MDGRPFFSIILPIKGHPLLLADALGSLLRQDCADLEVLVSNNGADPTVKPAIAHLMDDPRVRYVEQPEVLDMPTHFEVVSRLARGRYLILHTHRSVLKQHALSEIRAAHERFGADADVVSWAWDLYYEDRNLLAPNNLLGGSTSVLNSDDVILGSISGSTKFPYSLPRALNSSTSMDVLADMRGTFGEAFGKINPDFNFAYRSLMTRKSIVYIDKPLMTSQGFSISNGGMAMRGDSGAYIATLGLTDPFQHAPIKVALVENTIVEDFLKNASVSQRADLLSRWDRPAYYVKCLAEIQEKRIARILDRAHLDMLQKGVDDALAQEPVAVREAVAVGSSSKASLRQRLRRIGRGLLGQKMIERIRPILLQFRGASRHTNVMEASGFEAGE